MPDRSLTPDAVALFLSRAAADDPPPPPGDRPVHVLYGGAHLFDVNAPAKVSARAAAAMESWGEPRAFAETIGAPAEAAERIAERVRAKLDVAPIESSCIDFEDGYGPRSDDEEDGDAVRTAAALRQVPRVLARPPRIGIRVKALGRPTAARAIRTLDLFVTRLAEDGRDLPRGFSVTVPKVRRPEDVSLLVDVLEAIEARAGLPPIPIELMIETPRALFAADGGVAIPGLVAGGRGRVVALHLGAYDLTAELGVTAGDQRLDHPYCDLARALLVASVAGTGVGVADGATTLLPIAPKGAPPDEATRAVHRAWAVHAANVRRALGSGIWQGWDLHPAQLPARYGVLFSFFLERQAALSVRLRTFLDRAAQASRVGQEFDDAATAEALLGFFRRGHACGAFDADDLAAASLGAAELGQPLATIARARATGPSAR